MLCGILFLKGGILLLVLVDGVLGSLNIVVFEDVEFIDVLKDGLVIVIYGICGINGVIIIIIK